ncbi:MAG TPA: hypothetical protein VM433_08265 [Mycobacteriales bacterium]|nr:hypothetical protein [Mycobacteriales bacterium]
MLTVLLLTGMVAGAAPASAGIAEGPAAGEVVGVHSALRITASSAVSSLELVDPAGVVIPAAERTEGDRRPTILLKTACPLDPGTACGSGQVGANGQWLIRAGRGVEPQDAAEDRPFFLRIGGAAVTDVGAVLTERTARVTWRPGPEPDVTFWSVSDGADQAHRAFPAACADGVCSTTFDYPASASGPRTFAIRAARPCGVADCPDVLGPAATSAPVTLPDPPPGATPSTGPSSPGQPSPAAPGGAGVADQRTLGQGFATFAPKLGQPKLPPLPEFGAPQVAGPTLPDTFDPNLDYGDRELGPEVAQPPTASGRDGSTLTSTSSGLLGDEQIMRGIAGAMVLVLSGAHLRTWLARAREESAAL